MGGRWNEMEWDLRCVRWQATGGSLPEPLDPKRRSKSRRSDDSRRNERNDFACHFASKDTDNFDVPSRSRDSTGKARLVEGKRREMRETGDTRWPRNTTREHTLHGLVEENCTGEMALIAPRNSSPVVRDKESIPAYDVRMHALAIIFFWRLPISCYVCSVFCDRSSFPGACVLLGRRGACRVVRQTREDSVYA